MQEAQGRTFTWSLAMTLAAIGGAGVSGGVLLGWWTVAAYRESEIFGRELVEERLALGTAHWSGTATLVIGSVVVALSVVAVFVHGGAVRRVASIAALSGGFFLMAAAASGFGRSTVVAEVEVGGPGLTLEGSVAGGLVLSAVGGLVIAVAGFLARRQAAD